jgi:GT2 family glycosyltransferase/glycosyltransferase involved in cell wall biosynthesis
MRPGDPTLSAVILSWNRRAELRTTLTRLAALPDRPAETIVVDNGSTDGSPETVAREFPDVRLITLPRNIGIEALNAGFRAARGDVIVLLDDDSYPMPGALSLLARAYRDEPALGVAAGRISGPPGWWDAKWSWHDVPRGGDVPTFIGCGAGIRRAALERTGGFDGRFFLYQNESDLSARMIDAGFAVRYFPDIAFVHAVSAVNRKNWREEYYGLRNLLWMFAKYFPRLEAGRLSARVVAERIAYCILRRDPRSLWIAVRAAGAALRPPAPLGRRVLSKPARERLLAYVNLWYPPVTSRILRLRRAPGRGLPRTADVPRTGGAPAAGSERTRMLFIGAGDIRRSRGARTYLLSFVDALRHAGAEVQAFFLQQAIAGPPSETPAHVRILRAPGDPVAAAAVPVVLWRLYETVWAAWTGLFLALAHRTRCDVCVVTGPLLLPLTPLLRRAYGRLLYVEHGIAEELLVSATPRSRLKFWGIRLLERLFLRRYTAVTTVSTAMGAYFEQRDGVSRSLLVPCGVDPRKFRYSEENRVRLRAELGVGDRFVFVYSGGADLWQRRSEMIRVFQAAAAADWDPSQRPFFLLVSADPDGWRKFVAPLDPRDYAVVAAPHDGVAAYLSAADAAFLLRTRRLVDVVSCPVKFAEYLACGLPVLISPDIGDYTALVDRHRVGVVIDPDAPSTWAAGLDALRRLIGDPNLRQRCLGVAGTLSWDAVASRLLASVGNGAWRAAGAEFDAAGVADIPARDGVR